MEGDLVKLEFKVGDLLTLKNKYSKFPHVINLLDEDGFNMGIYPSPIIGNSIIFLNDSWFKSDKRYFHVLLVPSGVKCYIRSDVLKRMW